VDIFRSQAEKNGLSIEIIFILRYARAGTVGHDEGNSG